MLSCTADPEPTDGIPKEGTTIVTNLDGGQVIITVSNTDLNTDSYTIEGFFAHPIHGSVYTQTDEQIDSSLAQEQTAILMTSLKPEEDLVKVNVQPFQIQIIDVVNDNVAYTIQPYLEGEDCIADPLLELDVNNGTVCIVSSSNCYSVNTLFKYSQAQGFLEFPTTDTNIVSAFAPSFDFYLEATLFCVSPSRGIAFYTDTSASLIIGEIDAAFDDISTALVAPKIDESTGSVVVDRSDFDVHIGTNITAEKGVKKLELICYLDPPGVPVATHMWLKDGNPLEDSLQYDIRSDNKTLTFAEITDEDAGVYTCAVENIVGMDTASSFLTVVDPPTLAETTDPDETPTPTMATPQWVLGGDWTQVGVCVCVSLFFAVHSLQK